MPSSWGSSPLVPFIASNVTFALVLGFTGPRSPLRYVGLGAITYLAWRMIQILTRDRSEVQYVNAMLGALPWYFWTHYLDFAILSGWAFEVNGPTRTLGGLRNVLAWPPRAGEKPAARRGGFFSRLLFGLSLIYNQRLPGTPWQVKGVPPFYRNDPKRIPSRSVAIFWSGIAFAIFFLILDTLGSSGSKDNDKLGHLGLDKIQIFSRISEVSAEEIVVRMVATIMWWFVSFCVLQLRYNFFACTTLLAGLGKPEQWPPLFGPFADCWSIRNFHGSFWHQYLRQQHGAPAYFFVTQVLGLSPGTFIYRYSFVFFMFGLSGISHRIAEYADGVPFALSGCLEFWTMQAVGIVLEDGVQAAYRSIRGVKRTEGRLSLFERLAGYTWTFAWFVWTTPRFSYPFAARSLGAPILPFSILKQFRS